MNDILVQNKGDKGNDGGNKGTDSEWKNVDYETDKQLLTWKKKLLWQNNHL